jgi:hypothetical protein
MHLALQNQLIFERSLWISREICFFIGVHKEFRKGQH